MQLQQPSHTRAFAAFLSVPLSGRVRAILCTAVLLIAASYWFPLWRIGMTAPQYPDGLALDIYSWRIDSGHGGRDLAEINILNHYIGMRRIVREELIDLNWLPFAFGVLILLVLRAAVLGTVRTLVDLSVLTGYLCTFALFRFVWMLRDFGHNLDEKAPMDIEPFTPAIVGIKQVANFTTHSWPMPGTWMIAAFVCLLWLVTAKVLWDGWRAGFTSMTNRRALDGGLALADPAFGRVAPRRPGASDLVSPPQQR